MKTGRETLLLMPNLAQESHKKTPQASRIRRLTVVLTLLLAIVGSFITAYNYGMFCF